MEGGLIAKAVAGTGVVGLGTTALYFGGDYISNSLSKYETALINFLKDDNTNDIVFSVKKVTTSGSSDTESELNANDISFSSTSSQSPLKVRVKVTTDANTSLKKGSSTRPASQIEEIKKLGQDESKGWEWECNLSFEFNGSAGTTIGTEYKEAIWKNPDTGLFGLLKKELTNYPEQKKDNHWTKQELKQVKIDFISQCGYQRGVSKNKEINGKKAENTEIKINVSPFKFKVNNGNLVPEDPDRFGSWFKKDYKNRKHQTNTSGGGS